MFCTPFLKMVALPVIAIANWVHLPVTITPKNVAAPTIGVVWLRACTAPVVIKGIHSIVSCWDIALSSVFCCICVVMRWRWINWLKFIYAWPEKYAWHFRQSVYIDISSWLDHKFRFPCIGEINKRHNHKRSAILHYTFQNHCNRK